MARVLGASVGFLTCPNAETAFTRAAAIVGASVPLTFGDGTGFRKRNSRDSLEMGFCSQNY